jgi:hypothetical protein
MRHIAHAVEFVGGGGSEGEGHTEELEIDGKILLRWILVYYTGRVWNRIGTSGRLLWTWYEHSGSIKGGALSTTPLTILLGKKEIYTIDILLP